MSKKIKRLEADVVIAGTGPGGCAIAKHLSGMGKKLIMLEKSSDNAFLFGTPVDIFLKMEKSVRLPRGTMEGENVILANGWD